MSEYQYYAFVAVDNALTTAGQAEVRRLPTRARITATSFTNEYHWGNFRGDPRQRTVADLLHTAAARRRERERQVAAERAVHNAFLARQRAAARRQASRRTRPRPRGRLGRHGTAHRHKDTPGPRRAPPQDEPQQLQQPRIFRPQPRQLSLSRANDHALNRHQRKRVMAAD
jgi:hypothetical protein